MSSPFDHIIRVELFVEASQPRLLEGLDIWLRLGLISQAEVKQLCGKYLVCRLPVAELRQVPRTITTSSHERSPDSLREPVRLSRPTTRDSRSRLVQLLQSLMAELSVRWLLFLGMFMVVVSSGVLAASQWQQVPAVGQYGILFGYTLIFWGVGFWASLQQNLQLTAQSLQIVTLLLMPVNFWAMDSIGLWQHPGEWIAVAIAACILTFVTVQLIKNWLATTSLQSIQIRRLPAWNILGLSYLQWGWKLPGFPLIAVYLGMVGTALVAVNQIRYQQQLLLSDNTPNTPTKPQHLNLAVAVEAYALFVLLGRSLFIVHVPVTQLGLAIGICGWLLAWLSLQHQATQILDSTVRKIPLILHPLLLRRIGVSLLFLGWLVSVITFPWQALSISGLGLWFCISRLQQSWQRVDLAAILAIGLQTIWLIWRLVPSSLQTWAITSSSQLTNAETVPWALLSVALFPYVVVIVGITNWLDRRSKPDLANFGEQIALALGFVLSLIGLVNPTLRSLNLLLSTITLAVVTQQRKPTRVSLVYLTHITGLLTLGAIIAWLWSNLSLELWASIALAVMVAEWEFSIASDRRREVQIPTSHVAIIWRRSAWRLGLGLAGLSYALLLANTPLVKNTDSNYLWGLLWLITPIALTSVASRTPPLRHTTSSWLGVAAVGMAQVLTFTLPGVRVISLGVATGLMLVHTRYLRSALAATITVGASLCFIGLLLWDRVLGLPQLSASNWFLVAAIALTSLWFLHSWLSRRTNTLATLYAQATDGWAIALCSLQLFLLTVHSLGVYWAVLTPVVNILIAIALTAIGIAVRSRQQPSNAAFYGLGWCLELLIAEALGFTDRSVIDLTVANVILGLITQLVGDWWRRRVGSVPGSLHILPLLYGALAAVLRWNTFANWTGLSSLGIALIAIGVGRRQLEFKPLVYLGIIGTSFAAHELLFYQLSGVVLGDQLMAIAALNTSLLYAYHIFTPWLSEYLHLNFAELKVIAHLHWFWGSCLVIAAVMTSATNTSLGLGTGIFLTRYAIFQGRHNTNRIWAEIWVYLGLLEAVGIGLYLINTPLLRNFFEPLARFGIAIACVIAYFLYFLPWDTWGWDKKPWQRAAVILPLIAIAITINTISPVNLLIAAGFYVAIAWLSRQFRWTYLSVVLVDWALERWFQALQLTDPLWYITPIGLSLLYVAGCDHSLQLPENKQLRHNLRLLGTGVICLVALLWHQQTGILPGLLSLVAIFAGLALRVRAYLYVGTATFLLNAFYQLIILIFRYPFFKWIIGLIVGITLIWIAAQFETRRDQLSSLVRSWNSKWQDWE